MPLPWFRFYHEFSTDPKVQMLPEHYQRRYVMLLCLKCCNGDVTLQDEEVAFQLRISMQEWQETKHVLIEKKMLQKDNSPTNWKKRQQPSDSSTERVRRFRENKKKLQKQDCNVSVTVQKKKEIKNKNNNICLFDEFYSLYPRKEAKGKAEPAYKKAIKEGIAHEEIIRGLKAFNERIRKEGTEKRYIPLPASWLNAERWADKHEEIKKTPRRNVQQARDLKQELFS